MDSWAEFYGIHTNGVKKTRKKSLGRFINEELLNAVLLCIVIESHKKINEHCDAMNYRIMYLYSQYFQTVRIFD